MSSFSFYTDIIMIRPVGNNSAGERESAAMTEQRFSADIYIHTVMLIEAAS